MEIDVNKPVTNPALVAAAQRLGADSSPEAQNEFVAQLKQAHFLAPVSFEPPPPASPNGRVTLTKDTKINFHMLVSGSDATYYPAFTDWDEVAKFREPAQTSTLILTLDDYWATLQKDTGSQGLVVNPYGHNVVITREMLGRIFDEAVPYAVQKATRVMLGAPAADTSALTAAVSAWLKTAPGANRAYLRLMVKDNQQSLLIVVELAPGADRRAVFDGIYRAAKPFLNLPLDMVERDSDFGANATENVAPFYERAQGS